MRGIDNDFRRMLGVSPGLSAFASSPGHGPIRSGGRSGAVVPAGGVDPPYQGGGARAGNSIGCTAGGQGGGFFACFMLAAVLSIRRRAAQQRAGALFVVATMVMSLSLLVDGDRTKIWRPHGEFSLIAAVPEVGVAACDVAIRRTMGCDKLPARARDALAETARAFATMRNSGDLAARQQVESLCQHGGPVWTANLIAVGC
jgi:uncharacterized protein (TIGR03382 family)